MHPLVFPQASLRPLLQKVSIPLRIITHYKKTQNFMVILFFIKWLCIFFFMSSDNDTISLFGYRLLLKIENIVAK